MKKNIKKKNIIEAIKMGICYIKPWPPNNKIRCYDNQAGYGKYVDLSQEEYDIYQKVSSLTIDEQLKRLDRILT